MVLQKTVFCGRTHFQSLISKRRECPSLFKNTWHWHWQWHDVTENSFFVAPKKEGQRINYNLYIFKKTRIPFTIYKYLTLTVTTTVTVTWWDRKYSFFVTRKKGGTETRFESLIFKKTKMPLPVGETSGPSKNWGNAICAGFTALLVHPVMTCHSAMGCFRFNGLPIRTHLKSKNHIIYIISEFFF